MVAEIEQLQDRYVKVDGLTVRYWDYGEGPPVLLLHGLGASVEFWWTNVGGLARAHRVLALDLPGFGRSDRTLPRWSLDYVADFLQGFLAAVGAGRTSLVGNSMGGLIALRFALDRPGLVDRLVLVGSGGLGREVALSLRLLVVPRLGEILTARFDRPAVRRVILGLCCDPGAVCEDLERLAAAAYELSILPGARQAILRAARVGIDLRGQKRSVVLRGRLGELRAPTLIVWGQQDDVIPVGHAFAAHRLIPGAQLRILDRCGHCPQIERPSEFNALVARFLAG